MGYQTFFKYHRAGGATRRNNFWGKGRSPYGRQTSGYKYGGSRNYASGSRRAASSTWSRRSPYAFVSSSGGRKKKSTGRRTKTVRSRASGAKATKVDVRDARKMKEIRDVMFLGQKVQVPPGRGFPKQVDMYYHDNAARWYYVYPVNEILVHGFMAPMSLAQNGAPLKPLYLSSVTMSLEVERRVGVKFQATLIKVTEGPVGDGRVRQLGFRHSLTNRNSLGLPVSGKEAPAMVTFDHFGFAQSDDKRVGPRDRMDPAVQELASIAYPGAMLDNDLLGAAVNRGAVVPGRMRVGDGPEWKHSGNAYCCLKGDGSLDAKDCRYSWKTDNRIQVCDSEGNLTGDRYVILFVMKPIADKVSLLDGNQRSMPFATMDDVQVKCNIRYGHTMDDPALATKKAK